MKIFSVVNSKGGVGKTTVCVHLGHAMAMSGKKTLIIDMDMQDNIRIWFDVPEKETTLFEILIENKPIQEAIINVRENLDILPSGGDNLGAVPYLLNQKGAGADVLRNALASIKSNYDYILIDCSPSRSLLHTLAVVASDGILVPVNMEWLAVVGSGQVNKAITEVREKYQLSIEISLVVPTFLDRRRYRACDDVLDSLKKAYGDRLTNPIRVNGRLSEAPGFGKTCFDMSDHRGIEDFSELAERVMQIG